MLIESDRELIWIACVSHYPATIVTIFLLRLSGKVIDRYSSVMIQVFTRKCINHPTHTHKPKTKPWIGQE